MALRAWASTAPRCWRISACPPPTSPPCAGRASWARHDQSYRVRGRCARKEGWMAKVDDLKAMIADAESIVAFTGAGISTESGIPDYRSPGGIWTKFRPIDFGDFLASAEARRETWRRKFASHEVLQKATPNAGHRALARLVEQGKMAAVITQNIDGLHQSSGVPDDKVIELHGNATYASCLDCRRRYELDWVREIFAV